MMGFISKLKSFLGIGRTEPRNPVAETTIPVESPADQPEVREPEPHPQDETIEEETTDEETTDEETTDEETPEPIDSASQTDNTEEQSESQSGEPVQSIKGIGPSYADRLGEAGVFTVSDLADADPDALAAETGISATRISSWIELANAS